MAAGAQRFTISETNPNDSTGTGGCLCSEHRNIDRGGPYCVFGQNEMRSGKSPAVVLCAPCAVAFVGKVDSGAECLKLGQPVPEAVEPTHELIGHPTGRPESPVTDGLVLPRAPKPPYVADDEIAI